MLGCKPKKTPVIPNLDLWDKSSEMFEDVSWYRRLVGKLIYLTVTRLDITFVVGLINQFMHKPRLVHCKASLHMKSTPGKGLVYKHHGHLKVTGYSQVMLVIKEIRSLLLATTCL